MVGSIGIGAPFDGPFDQVDRFGSVRDLEIDSLVEGCTTNGRGTAMSLTEVTWDEADELSDRPINDFLNHEGFDEGVTAAASAEKSFEPL